MADGVHSASAPLLNLASASFALVLIRSREAVVTRRVLAAAAFVGTLFVSASLSAQAAGGAGSMSRSRGLSLGASGTGTSVSTTSDGTTNTEYGYGYQVEAAYGFARRFSLGLEYAYSNIDSKVEIPAYTLSHVGLVGRVFFRDDGKRARPYAEGALLNRTITIDSTDSVDESDVTSSSLGGGLGFGVAFYANPRLAFDFSGQAGFGTFSDWKANGNAVASGDVSATSLILRLGARYYIR